MILKPLKREQHEKDRTELKRMGFDNGSDNPLMRNVSAQSVHKTKEIIAKCVKTHSYNFEQAFFSYLFLFHTAKQRGSSTLNQITKSPGALTGKTTSGKERRKKGIWLLLQLSLHLPLSVNHFLLSWAVCSRYYSNYPKQKNYGEKEQPVSYGFL